MSGRAIELWRRVRKVAYPTLGLAAGVGTTLVGQSCLTSGA
jgi:hypothetical protein